MKPAPSRHVLGLDLVRFAAAAMVMVFHYGPETGGNLLSQSGWVGVEIFFVVSGLVISWSAQGATARTFATARFVRLMPAVWVCGTATAVAASVGGIYHDLGSRYAATLVLWPAGPWVDGVYWTLPVEIAFYGFVFLAIASRRERALPALLTGCFAVSAVWWAARVFDQFCPRFGIVAVLAHLPPIIATLAMPDYGAYFALGGFLFLCAAEGVTLRRLALIGGCLVVGAAQIVFIASIWVPVGRVEKLVPVAIWLAAVALIVASVATNRLMTRSLGRYSPAIRLVGLATYPLYLLHDGIGTEAMRLLGFTVLETTALMIVLSVAVAAFIEPPLQRVLRSLLSAPHSQLSSGRVP